jgi:hypothetical protein
MNANLIYVCNECESKYPCDCQSDRRVMYECSLCLQAETTCLEAERCCMGLMRRQEAINGRVVRPREGFIPRPFAEFMTGRRGK